MKPPHPAPPPPKVGVNASSAHDGCLADRHWYAFLCSSAITFLVGLLLVLSWRIIAWVFCQNYVTKSRRKSSSGGLGGGGSANHAKALGDHRGGIRGASDANIGWMTEAKDWAGELISGQTTTGRILVRSVGPTLFLHFVS